ncbi:MAG: DEAD/DEAH box helicase [Ardenticatenaceae bacterium]
MNKPGGLFYQRMNKPGCLFYQRMNKAGMLVLRMSFGGDMMSTILSSVPINLLPGAEEVLAAVAEGRFRSERAYNLQLQAERLLLVSGFDELICLDAVEFTPFAYQIKAAQTALRRFRGRGMLCDEVGLGKTIEAGLVIKEYMLRQMAERVLILAPPGLVVQWQEELAQKFGLRDFVSNSDEAFRALGSEAWAHFPRVVASLAAARLKKNRELITKLNYDLIVVDEAHHLKNRSSVSWKFVNSLQKKYILMLTATPVENRLEELYNLITILKPGQLKTPKEFKAEFMVRGDPRLPKNRGRLRSLLADVMVRHSRAQVSVKLPPRRAHTVTLSLSEPEQALYDDVSKLVRDSYQKNVRQRLTLRALQRQIGSSPPAATRRLQVMAGKPAWKEDRAQLREFAERANAITSWAKWEALQKLIHAAGEDKLIIFSHFRSTLSALAERLTEMGADFVLYHGGLTIKQKDEAIRQFEGQKQILLSSEAAGEGRNLQFCHIMINFDLPWNPQRIEQRVGRIHRVGQTERVEIFNLSAKGTIEEYLLDILDRKLNMFELVIGEMEMILGHLTKQQDFEEMLLEVWLNHADEDALAAGMEELGEELISARRKMEKAQEYDDALFGEDFAIE